MKIVKCQFELDEHILEDWDRLEEWIERTLVHEIADKLYKDNLVDFIRQDDGNSQRLEARLYLVTEKEFKKLKQLKNEL